MWQDGESCLGQVGEELITQTRALIGDENAMLEGHTTETMRVAQDSQVEVNDLFVGLNVVDEDVHAAIFVDARVGEWMPLGQLGERDIEVPLKGTAGLLFQHNDPC